MKFYYLDEDAELISISTELDYLNAIEFCDGAPLKLTLAENSQDALAMI